MDSPGKADGAQTRPGLVGESARGISASDDAGTDRATSAGEILMTLACTR
jgi:hypothetical protein